MTFTSFSAVLFTAAFFVPGYVFSRVRERFIVRRDAPQHERLLEYFTLSCFNNAFWAIGLTPFADAAFLGNHQLLAGLEASLMMLVSPLILAVLATKAQNKELVAWFAKQLSFQTIHPSPSAWDWHFSRQGSAYVVVHLKDGRLVHGTYADRSIAGDRTRDLFLQEVFVIDDGKLKPLNAGIWISHEQIACITFSEEVLPDEQERVFAGKGQLSAGECVKKELSAGATGS